MLEKLKGKSKRVDRGKYQISDLKLVENPQQMASYKDYSYRQKIAARYGIVLINNEQGYQSPVLTKYGVHVPEKTIYQNIVERFSR